MATMTDSNPKQESNQSVNPIENLLIVGGEKGGVGKSKATTNLIGYITRKKWEDKITVFDADPSIDDVYQVYQNEDWM